MTIPSVIVEADNFPAIVLSIIVDDSRWAKVHAKVHSSTFICSEIPPAHWKKKDSQSTKKLLVTFYPAAYYYSTQQKRSFNFQLRQPLSFKKIIKNMHSARFLIRIYGRGWCFHLVSDYSLLEIIGYCSCVTLRYTRTGTLFVMSLFIQLVISRGYQRYR